MASFVLLTLISFAAHDQSAAILGLVKKVYTFCSLNLDTSVFNISANFASILALAVIS